MGTEFESLRNIRSSVWGLGDPMGQESKTHGTRPEDMVGLSP